MILFKHLAILVLSVLLAAILVPLVFLLELYLIGRLPTGLVPTLEISVGDALTVATILGAMGVFVLERYQAEKRDTIDQKAGGALRLILKHVREQDEPKTITEHWKIFVADQEGRETFCEGAFSDISLNDFTAEVYALRLEGQIDITYGGQLIPRLPFEVKVKRLTQTEKRKLLGVLSAIAQSSGDEYDRAESVRMLGEVNDPDVISILLAYLEDSSVRVRLAASKALLHLGILPED